MNKTNTMPILGTIVLMLISLASVYLYYTTSTNYQALIIANDANEQTISLDNQQIALLQNELSTTLTSTGDIKEFSSGDALAQWLSNDDTHLMKYTPDFQCVDFAFTMSEHAIKDGYWLFPMVDTAAGHAWCTTLIGNTLYSIEPQTNYVTLWGETPTAGGD